MTEFAKIQESKKIIQNTYQKTFSHVQIMKRNNIMEDRNLV